VFSDGYNNNRDIAIKFEKTNQVRVLLFAEVKVIRALDNVPHFPKFYGFGTHENYKFLAMELLGPSLLYRFL
jgi:predicted Ser/Thr protein kinase